MNTLVVKNKLKSIFEYRVTKVDELFNKSNEQVVSLCSDAICVSRITYRIVSRVEISISCTTYFIFDEAILNKLPKMMPVLVSFMKIFLK
jgi:hypothetical protein